MGQQGSQAIPRERLCRERPFASRPVGRTPPILYRPDGTKRLADNTLAALTLMIAESRTEEKDVMVKVVVNLINQRNE
jgi:hypothetical protein